MIAHSIRLTDDQRAKLEQFVTAGTHPVRQVRRAWIVLKSADGLSAALIREHLGCGERTVRAVRQRFATEGLDRALLDAPRSGTPPKFTAAQIQRVIALACSDPPDGRARWTLALLCQQAQAEGIVDSVSISEMSLWLAEHDLKPWRKKRGASRN